MTALLHLLVPHAEGSSGYCSGCLPGLHTNCWLLQLLSTKGRDSTAAAVWHGEL